MGLRRTKSSPLHAGVCPKSPHPFPTPSPGEATGSTLPSRQTKLWGKHAILTRGRRLTSAQQGREKFIQEVCGVFLFLARTVDGGLLPAHSSLASQQANPTEKTMVLCKQYLDFMASQEDAVLTYQASNMVLAIHSDVSYLSKPKSRSRAGGHMFMAGKDEIPINNGAVFNISQIIRAVMSSAAEAQLGALFINAKTAV